MEDSSRIVFLLRLRLVIYLARPSLPLSLRPPSFVSRSMTGAGRVLGIKQLCNVGVSFNFLLC
jgi:hypothetical protein